MVCQLDLDSLSSRLERLFVLLRRLEIRHLQNDVSCRKIHPPSNPVLENSKLLEPTDHWQLVRAVH